MRQGRHRRRLSSPTTWIAAAIAACVAGVVALSTAPAEAKAATVDAQLSLSGLATKANVLGGSKIGVHPGDTVDFKASPLPTAGLNNVPALGGLLSGVLSSLTASNFQVIVTFPASFPGGARTVKLGGPTSGTCAGKADLPVTFAKKGTYNFTWTVQTIATGLLGCSATGINSTALNQLKQAGVALNASNQWVGKIEVAKNATDGGISIQLPGVGAAPSVTGVGRLPGVTISPINVPTVPISVPSITSKVGSIVRSVVNRATGGKSTPAKGGAPSSRVNVKYTPPALTVPQKVMPHAVNVGGARGTATGAGFGAPAGGSGGGGVVAPRVTSTAPNPATSVSPAPKAKPAGKSVDLADKAQLGGQQLPALLAIAAILALSLVTAAYARLVLLRRKPTA